MAKQKSIFVCGQCGYETGSWLGKCPSCGEWNSLMEQAPLPARAAAAAAVGAPRVTPISQVRTESAKRLSTGASELDRVLGGGLVPASVVLCGGDPGIGKSTLLLQAAAHLAASGPVLYVTAEESPEQIRLRADRLGTHADALYILAENNLETIEAAIEAQKYPAVIIDSIQTVYTAALSGAQGSVSQVRECAARLLRQAKRLGCAMFLVGHVTKDGALAGPKVLEHIVDTVLYFEGEKQNAYRVLRAVKNRFGSTNEVGLFEMGDKGMHAVENPSALLLAERSREAGNAIFCAMEGTRPMLLEVQALCSPTPFSSPRRTCTGLEMNRLLMLLAVMEKKLGYRLSEADVYANVAGGIKIEETGADLAVLAALASSVRSLAIPPDTAFLGEVGLTGELRGIGHVQSRLAECARNGFTRVFLPHSVKVADPLGLKLVRAQTARQALQILFATEG